MDVSPSYTQSAFRFRNDDGNETAATWRETLDTNTTAQTGANRVIRLRVRVSQTISAANIALSKVFKVRYSTGGAYANVGAQGASVPIRYFDSTHVTHQGTTTNQLSTTGFVSGRIDEQGNSGTIAFTSAATSATEVEFVLEVVDSLVSESDFFDLRVYETSDTALDTYSVTPRITVVPAAPGTPTASASTVSRTRIDLTLGAGTGAASHTLHRSTTDGFTVGGGNQIASFGATPTSPYENTGLDPGTTYYYRLRATNAGGSTDSTQTSATTTANQPPVTQSIVSVEMI
jgi:hypothetical protein